MKAWTTLLISLMFAAGAASAADPVKPAQPTSSHAGHQVPADAFAKLDANADGLLSKVELAKHPMGGHAVMVDANKDGLLSPSEFAALEAM